MQLVESTDMEPTDTESQLYLLSSCCVTNSSRAWKHSSEQNRGNSWNLWKLLFSKGETDIEQNKKICVRAGDEEWLGVFESLSMVVK